MSQGHYFTRDMPMSDITDAGSNLGSGLNRGMAIAKFYTQTVQDFALSETRGRFVGRDVEMVRVIIPGDKHNIVERRIKPSDKIQYAKEYEAFRKMEDYTPDGTLLQTWPMLSRAQVEDMRYMNIFTVEQIAELPDDRLSALGLGGRMWRNHAKAFLEASRTGAVPAQLVAENERLKNSVELLSKQLQELSNRFEIGQAKAGKEVGDMDSPVAEARAAMEFARSVPKTVAIPDDYQSLSLKGLKALTREFSDVPVITKEQAFELIGEYKAQF